MFGKRSESELMQSVRQSEVRSDRQLKLLRERVEEVEDAWADTLSEIHRWRTWMTLCLFTLAVTSLVLSGIYLGGVLF